jgi:hypothetical protein
MKKIILFLFLFLSLMTANAQNSFVKYEFMKVMPGQDYEKLEKSWVNYHKELIKAGIISRHRIWKVLPGTDVDYDYVVSTLYNSYEAALGLGKRSSINVDDFKKKYPQDYDVMMNQTLKTRTMVSQVILKPEFNISDSSYKITPGETIMKILFVKSKDGKYTKGEIEFDKKWQQLAINNNFMEGFSFIKVVGNEGTESPYTHMLQKVYSSVGQMTMPTDFKYTTEDLAFFEILGSYRDITKSVLLLNVSNIE